MAVKNIISMGIGFIPGSIKFIPTLGYSIGTAIIITSGTRRQRRIPPMMKNRRKK